MSIILYPTAHANGAFNPKSQPYRHWFLSPMTGFSSLKQVKRLVLSLANRRLHLKLCYLYKIVHQFTYFSPNVVVPTVARSHHSTPYSLQLPFAHTNSYFYSFIPHSISLWNELSGSVTSASFPHSFWVHYIIISLVPLLNVSFAHERIFIYKTKQNKKNSFIEAQKQGVRKKGVRE